MRRLFVILVCNIDGKTMLMCKRRKPPGEGLFNFVGGSLDDGEDGVAAAYRKLAEETGIREGQIGLSHVMDMIYYGYGYCLEVYAGRLLEPADVWGKENELLWMGIYEDFFNREVFAGEGNIGHIVEHVRNSTDIFG